MKSMNVAWSLGGLAVVMILSAGGAEEQKPTIVSFKDAAKIKSWDAWGDHLKKKAPKTIFEKEKKCITWQNLCKLSCGLEPAGQLETRLASDIKGSKWSIGCETMDRDYADWNSFKDYLPHLGAKRGRLFSGWAKTEQEKGKYDFTWLDPQVREMAAMGVKPWICLSYGNPVWGSDFRLGMRVKQVTDNPAAFEAWLRYCTACVERYKDVVDEWEIWNEPFHQAPEYAEMFYRTAKAIRAVQPTAKCYVTAISWSKKGESPEKSDYAVVLERLKKENALDLASLFIYHPYWPNPDTAYAGFAEPLRKLVKSYSPNFDIFQGEVGCPAQLEYAHAMHTIEWTEYSQAKWNLRRTIGDAVRDIPCNVFTCVDLQYTFMLQSFGQLRCNLLKEVVYRRPSFYAMQHVFSYFDEDVHPVSVTKQTVNGKELTVAQFERQSNPVYVLWFSGERPGDTLAYENGDVLFDQFGIWDPVWVDLLTGKICKFPRERVVREGTRTRVKGIPLWDSPVMLTVNGQVPRKTDWPNMKPAEIVDALYRPNQGLCLGRNGRPRKMDLSNEPWTKMSTKDFLPCFDKFGQFKWRDWPGKTHSDEELKSGMEAEEADLAANPGPADRDQFGGWTKGPKQAATGRFYPKKIDGKWWLVDPEGNLFWSWGPVRVTPSSALTPLNGNPRTPKCGGTMPDRDCLFTDLPKKGDPLAQFYDTYDALLLPFYLKRDETRRFDFSAANLYRKYGDKWFEKYSDSCHRRLRSWGCNTIANSSDLKICLQDRTPYAERVEVASRPIAGSWGSWFKFRDPFDPSFHTACLAALAEHGREAHDPWCIGFFIDNEIQWGSKHEDLARWTLWSPDDQPAKIEFVKRLAAKGIVWDGNMDKVPVEELRAFTDVIVEEYFKRTRAALKEFDPGLLYLGCRFASSARPWAIKACVKYCDVVSYNIYADSIRDWRLPENLDAPVMIGEFHFGAHDRGLFGASLINKDSQEARAAALKVYVESALANPQMVGVHWHQFSDQATSGRFDGEYFQVGWTDVCDKPYAETIKALREVGYPLYETRRAVDPVPVAQRKSLKVLMIGNSFSICLLKEMPNVAKAMGLDLDLCSLYIGGCSLERHWQNVQAPESAPYQVGWDVRGEQNAKFSPIAAAVRTVKPTGKKSYTGGNIPGLLKAEKWDIVTIQQASHFSWQPSSYHPFGDNLVKTIRELAPQAKIVVQETWSYTPWDKRFAKWGIDQNEMYAKLHVAYADFAKAYGFDVLPVGTAVQLWRQQLPVTYTENSFGGDVCGSAKFVKDGKGSWVTKGDVFHFNADGHYLQALVWTAKLFGVDVTKCPYAPAQLSAEKAALMKKVAMEAVRTGGVK